MDTAANVIKSLLLWLVVILAAPLLFIAASLALAYHTLFAQRPLINGWKLDSDPRYGPAAQTFTQ